MKFVKYILFSVFLFVLIGVCAQERREYNIKVLHSYHQGLEWTDNISSGILSVFNDREDVNLFFEYLYAKTYPVKEYTDMFLEYHRKRSKIIKPDVIIISDNAAFDFMLQYGQELYPDVPVVFCGVNNLEPSLLKDYPNFFGVGEKADHEGTINAIDQLFSKRKDVLIINDNSLTGTAIRAELEQVIENYRGQLNFEFVSDFTINTLQEKVRSLGNNYVIYLLVVNRDKNGKFISYRNGISNIYQASNVPIFGSWDFYVDKGLLGGKILRGIDQGEYVAKLAEHIINGASLDTIKQCDFLSSKFVFDHKELKRFKIAKTVIPKESIIINKPVHKEQFYRIMLVVLVFTILGILLLLFLVRRKQLRALQLERMVNERTYELEKTNDKLSQLINNRDKFITILGHDLRNSMNNMMTSIFLLDTCQKDEDPQQGMVATQMKLKQIVQQTYNLLEDLLYWGMRQMKDKQDLVLSRIDVRELLHAIINSYEVNSNNVSLKLEVEDDLHFQSDAEISQFIIRNIVQNAVKFSHNSGCVKVIAYQKGVSLFVEVIDYGMGMSKEIIDSIYSKNPIKQTGNRQKISTGIGLSNALGYLELLSGKLTIESQLGKGSLFRIELPEKV